MIKKEKEGETGKESRGVEGGGSDVGGVGGILVGFCHFLEKDGGGNVLRVGRREGMDGGKKSSEMFGSPRGGREK